MIKYVSLQNISITKKLLLGFSLLILFSVLLSLTGFHAIDSSNNSLNRLSRLGSIFDETVAIREDNFAYMLERKDSFLEHHESSINSIDKKLTALLTDIEAGN